MLDEIVNALKNFREKSYSFFHHRKDAAMELVDALSSNIKAKSIVELSLSPLHRRNYCSITRVVDEFYISNTRENKRLQNKQLTQLLSSCCAKQKKRSYYVFGVDCTSNPRQFSPTLEDRSFVYAPNPVPGNKPITVGHQYSIAAYL